MYWFLFFCFSFVKLSVHSGSTMEVLTLNWKKSLFTIAAIQVGTGVSIIGVLSFIPLFLVEMGVKDPGEAAFWAGLISGVTPMMVSFSAPLLDKESGAVRGTAYSGPHSGIDYRGSIFLLPGD